MSETANIPPALADRFMEAFDAFLASVTTAVTDAEQNPEQASTPDFRAWKNKVLPLLKRQNNEAQQAVEAFRKGDPAPLLAIAQEKRGLAKDLDAFPLTFAGPAHAETLDALETALVTAAYHLCAAAGVP
ncbi:MAG TPA: hypothetical protein VHE33_07295 [Acidobacteriaceae bacterium]|nr:hypothetical protein [Acidobacteriaceae bacterium]